MSKGDWIVLLVSIPVSLVCGLAAGLLVEPVRRRYNGWGKTRAEAREKQEHLERTEIMSYVNNPNTFTQYLAKTAIDMLRITFMAAYAWVVLVGSILIAILVKIEHHTLPNFDRYLVLSFAVLGGISVEVCIAMFVAKEQSLRHRWNLVKGLERYQQDRAAQSK